MKKTMATMAVFLFVVFSYSNTFAQKEEAKTVFSGSFGASSIQHEFDTGESKFNHPVGYFSLKVERKLSEKLYGCLEAAGYFALNQSSPNKGEKIKLGGCLVYKLAKNVKLEASVSDFETRKYSIKKLGFIASKAWKFKVGLFEIYNNTMLFSGSDSHQKTGVLNKTGVSGTFHLFSKTKANLDVSLGGDNAPLDFKKSAASLFLKTKLERKVSKHWAIFGEWKYSKPFTETREPVSSFHSGLSFKF